MVFLLVSLMCFWTVALITNLSNKTKDKYFLKSVNLYIYVIQTYSKSYKPRPVLKTFKHLYRVSHHDDLQTFTNLYRPYEHCVHTWQTKPGHLENALMLPAGSWTVWLAPHASPGPPKQQHKQLEVKDDQRLCICSDMHTHSDIVFVLHSKCVW